MSNKNKSHFNPGSGLNLIALIGSFTAALCSYQINQSIFWAMLHAFCSWFYLLYLCMGFGGGLPPNFW